MKHFYLIVNKEKENAEKGAEMIAEYLSGRDANACGIRNRRTPPSTAIRTAGRFPRRRNA